MRRCIEQKRDGGELSFEQWDAIARAYMSGAVGDAQMAALCMACVLQGMSFDEAYALTHAMVQSGEVLSFEHVHGIVVDKHSSGGVSDIVSLAAVPLAAACGAHVAKLSGRALGHTGGTIDKLGTIPGFNAAITTDAFIAQVERIGCAIASQSERLVPLDKRLYALRDRTATVPTPGLIASSIVSKKIAGGANAFVFDVKTGAAAFMRETESAQELARWLLEIAARFDRRAIAFVTDMNEPLGRSIGTGIEVCEARDLLAGRGDERARELVFAIAGALLTESAIDEADDLVRDAWQHGRGLEKFEQMIAAQGGEVQALRAMQPRDAVDVVAEQSGYVSAVDVVRLGNAGRALSQNDPLAGLQVLVRIGDFLEKGRTLLRAFGVDRDQATPLVSAFTFSGERVTRTPLIHDVLVNSARSRRSNRAGAL